ncbi:1999_t:CDS:2, partial [Gigaspora margarita]
IAWDYFKPEKTKDELFDVCQLCKEKNILVKYIYDSLTGNMLGHLWTKYRIDKNYPDETKLVEFVIEDYQPLNILRCGAFRRLLNNIEPEFKISFVNGGFVNLTTDLWSSKTNKKYIKVTATWISSNFVLKEALLTIQPLPSPHTAKNIKNALEKVITEWELTEKVFCITTDNGVNIKKTINLMDNIVQSACSAYTLQLSVLKGFKPAAQLIKRAKNLILFFSQSPKQIEHFKDAQEQCQYQTICKITDDDYHLIEPPVTTITAKELYDLVKATSYFSLKEYWDIPEEAALIVSFLDPQIKNLKFIDNETKNTTKNYESSNMPTYNSTMANDLVSDLYSIEESDEIDKETKVDCYLHEPTQKDNVTLWCG